MAAILVGCSASNDEIQSEKSAEAFTEDDSDALHVDDIDEASTTKVSIDNSPEAQLQTLYDLKEAWELKDGNYTLDNAEVITFDDYGYAITDLDRDDNLEIIVSGIAGTGRFSTSHIYEYSSTDNIVEWDTSKLACNDSEPDFLTQNDLWDLDDPSEDLLPGCYSSTDDSYVVYMLADYQNYGASGGKTDYLKVIVSDNSIESSVTASQEIVEGTSRCTDSEENPLSFWDLSIELMSIYGQKEDYITTIKWFTEATLENLTESYEYRTQKEDMRLYDFDPKRFADVTLNETVAENIEINIDSAVYDYSDIDEESKQLYRDFLEGNATAIFKENDADVTENNWFSELFHTGDSYSLEDIVNGVITSDTYNVESFEKIFCTYLDCGTDNEYEFLVKIQFNSYTANYLELVLKNIDGKLYICMVCDTYERKYSALVENGLYQYMWNENGTSHIGKEYYIDATGKVNYLYTEGYDSIDAYYFIEKYGSELSTQENELLNNIVGVQYCFTSYSDTTDADKYACYIDIFDESNNMLENNEENQELYSLIQRLMEADGFIVITDEEDTMMQQNVRESVGLTDEIYTTEVGYYE